MNWYLAVLEKYAVFSGRARRKEYWMFALFNLIIYFVLSLLATIAGGGNGNSGGGVASVIYGISSLYSLSIIIPSLAVFVRRMHDIGKSGWWFFISLIPLVGGIWLLVLLCTDSQPGTNQYGPNPKETMVTPPIPQ